MELTVALCVSLISCVMSVSNFVTSRKDKSNKHVEEEVKQYSKHDLIEYRLNELTKKVDKILDKLDKSEKEVDEKIQTALKQHIATYHK